MDKAERARHIANFIAIDPALTAKIEENAELGNVDDVNRSIVELAKKISSAPPIERTGKTRVFGFAELQKPNERTVELIRKVFPLKNVDQSRANAGQKRKPPEDRQVQERKIKAQRETFLIKSKLLQQPDLKPKQERLEAQGANEVVRHGAQPADEKNVRQKRMPHEEDLNAERSAKKQYVPPYETRVLLDKMKKANEELDKQTVQIKTKIEHLQGIINDRQNNITTADEYVRELDSEGFEAIKGKPEFSWLRLGKLALGIEKPQSQEELIEAEKNNAKKIIEEQASAIDVHKDEIRELESQLATIDQIRDDPKAMEELAEKQKSKVAKRPNEMSEEERDLQFMRDMRNEKAAKKAKIEKGIEARQQVAEHAHSPLGGQELFSQINEAISMKDSKSAYQKIVNMKSKDIDVKDEKNSTLLHYACIKGMRDIVDLLLLKGAKANELNNKGFTPIMIACRKKNMDIIKSLLENGKNFASLPKDENGNTDLHNLLSTPPGNDKEREDLLEIYTMLRKHPTLANEPNNDGITPLQCFEQQNNFNPENEA